MDIGIVARPDSDRATALVGDLAHDLTAAGIDVSVAPGLADSVAGTEVPAAQMRGYPMVVSVGGDGTFLYTARHVGSTPILGVNLGEVGFLNAVVPTEATDRVFDEIDRIRDQGHPQYREVNRLAAAIDDGSLPPALNEIAVLGEQRGRGGGIGIEVLIDGSAYTVGHADGVLVATQTGSTAYNLSEGGPLIHPSATGLAVTVMCGPDSMPPLVIGADVAVSVTAHTPGQAVVASDGRCVTLDTPTTVEIGLADEPGRIAGPPSDFFEALEKIGRPAAEASS